MSNLMHGYGPTLADQGYSIGDVRDAEQEAFENRQRQIDRTGWAFPMGLECDLRTREHYFFKGGRSACGKWSAPVGYQFSATPLNGHQCMKCWKRIGSGYPLTGRHDGTAR